MKINLLLIISIFIINPLFGQTANTIKGIVKDAARTALVGGNVYEKGTTNGVSVDADGKFVIQVNSTSSIIEVSCMGYTPKELKVSEILTSNGDLINPDASELVVELVEGT